LRQRATFTSFMAICFVISTSAARQLLLREPEALNGTLDIISLA
jgi:hypothetical protein